MLKNFRIEIYILVILILGLFVSYDFDISLHNYFTNFSNSSQNIYLKKFFINITSLGNSLWYFMFSLMFFIILFFLKKSNKFSKKHERFNKLIFINNLLFLSVLISGILTQIIKHLIGRPRPNMVDIENNIGINFFSIDSNFHSFPSGHTATIFAVALICSLTIPKLKYFFYFLAGIVAFSRVMVGAHYITDIIAGTCVAFIGFKLSIIILNKISHFKQNENALVITNNNLTLVLIAAGVLAIFFSIGPALDIYLSGLFYLGGGEFLNQSYYKLTIFFRKIILNLILFYILILPILSIFVPIQKIYFNYKFKLREIFLIWGTLIFNLVIFINLILKNYWGRARPNDILELGGKEIFSPWHLLSNHCSTNCSFVSGDAAVGFSLIIFFFVIKREIFIKLSLFFGFVLGLIRISEGGHFLSDIILSCLIVFLFSFIIHFYFSKKINA